MRYYALTEQQLPDSTAGNVPLGGRAVNDCNGSMGLQVLFVMLLQKQSMQCMSRTVRAVVRRQHSVPQPCSKESQHRHSTARMHINCSASSVLKVAIGFAVLMKVLRTSAMAPLRTAALQVRRTWHTSYSASSQGT
jgi:hypothetical protein